MSYRWHRFAPPAALAVAALFLGMPPSGGEAGAAPVHGWSILRSPWQWSWGSQGPPPPITPGQLLHFHRLVALFEAMDDGVAAPAAFFQWIVANGVVDPREQYCLMWLYLRWIEATPHR